jgi:hypothetical protein
MTAHYTHIEAEADKAAAEAVANLVESADTGVPCDAQPARMPPSTASRWPVTNDASSESR